MQELLGVGTCVINVHGNNDEAVLAEFALHPVHPGKRLATGRAPRGPEVKIDHSPAKFIQIKRHIGIGWRDHKAGVSQEDADTPILNRAHCSLPTLHAYRRKGLEAARRLEFDLCNSPSPRCESLDEITNELHSRKRTM